MRRLFVDKNYYYCMHCQEWIIEDNMVSWSCKTKKGFCRECDRKLTLNEKMECEEVGFYQGEQLAFL